MSSTRGSGKEAGNGADESSSVTNTLFTSPFSPPRTMEEAWRHISLASPSYSARAPFGNGIPNDSMLISSSTAAEPTSLDFPHPMMQNQLYCQLFCINRPFVINPDQGLANSTSSCFGTGKKKRVLDYASNSEDPRHKRMIKNRESASRSRARKQAYTGALELEVQHLKEENERIRRQQQQLQESSFAAASGQPKKHKHRRSSTAHF
ncbi:protein FD-like [Argentina anserina]|uniref:protein FD-like n=1 Tax=Argentina anserina TaxID=57926 RepID=UPI00217674D9|nr:protein FD-like [Potentilla anserina]